MAHTLVKLARDGLGFALTAAGEGFRLARGAAEQVKELVLDATPGDARPGADERAEEDRGRPAARAAEAAATPTPRPGPAPPTAAEAVAAEFAEPRAWEPRTSEPSPPDPAFEHVAEEATLAAESADPGAEGGAGPEITIAPPWPGYDDMRARDIVDRLNAAEADVAATVRLYEASKRRRKTVLEAAERATRA